MEVVSSELPAILLSYCKKIASSLVYLGLKGFIHRDLAARNILVSKEGDCKVSKPLANYVQCSFSFFIANRLLILACHVISKTMHTINHMED